MVPRHVPDIRTEFREEGDTEGNAREHPQGLADPIGIVLDAFHETGRGQHRDRKLKGHHPSTELGGRERDDDAHQDEEEKHREVIQ